MVPCFHQSNAYVKRKLQVWRVQKCILQIGAKTALACARLQTTPSHESQYRAENGNLRKSESTFSRGSVFAPKQCLYQKEATGMESAKMHSSNRCKNRTYLCGTSNYPVSCNTVQGRERNFAEIRFYLSPWYRVFTKAMLMLKGSYRYGESKNAFFKLVQKPHLPVHDYKLPRLMRASTGLRTEICGNPSLPLAVVPCLHQSNVYIKRKLQVWRVLKCILLVG